jgi:hypothetical protein
MNLFVGFGERFVCGRQSARIWRVWRLSFTRNEVANLCQSVQIVIQRILASKGALA